MLKRKRTKVECAKCGAELCPDKIAYHQRGSLCRQVVCHIESCRKSIPAIHYSKHYNQHSIGERNTLPSSSVQLVQPGVPEFESDPEYSDIYSTFRRYIEPFIKIGRIQTIYNYQFCGDQREITGRICGIFDSQSYIFKMTISLSYILKNTETDELLFYWSSSGNQHLLDQPMLIGNGEDKDRLTSYLQNLDIYEHVKRPNTKYIISKITNFTFYLTRLIGLPIGIGDTHFPQYLIKNRGLFALIRNKNNGHLYQDSLCLFRCIALFNGFKITSLERETKRLFRQYCFSTGKDEQSFGGVTLPELEQLSKIFDLGFNVYCLEPEGDAGLIYRSIKQDNIVNLNLHESHFSYIFDFQKYCSLYRCKSCNKIFPQIFNLKRHSKSCSASTKQVFGATTYSPKESIFEVLERFGVDIPEELRYFEYFICMDAEATLKRETGEADTAKTSLLSKHELASISICSNVPSYTHPKCVISNGSSNEVVTESLNYMERIAANVYELQCEKFDEFMTAIDLIDNEQTANKFETYMRQVPVLTFNGG